MRIACVAWGSLIWNPGDLPIRKPWKSDGPLLPVEFARFSSESRVTLVIAEGHPSVQSFWSVINSENLDDVVAKLAEREGVSNKNIERDIGRWRIGDTTEKPIVQSICSWAMRQRLDAVVWTALPFRTWKDGDRLPTLEEIFDRLREAEKHGTASPREYVEFAPRQIDTRYRRAINKEFGWICRSDV